MYTKSKRIRTKEEQIQYIKDSLFVLFVGFVLYALVPILIITAAYLYLQHGLHPGHFIAV